MDRSYSHLAPEERALIEILNKQWQTQLQIGVNLGHDPRTILRELARNRRAGCFQASSPGNDPSQRSQAKADAKLALLTPLFEAVELRIIQR